MPGPSCPSAKQPETILSRRQFVGASLAMALVACFPRQTAAQPKKLVLRSSWQTVNIGDIAHTPGMLALLEKYLPDTEITLWPNKLNAEVEQILTTRFPKLKIAATSEQQHAALAECDFFLHGSGPGVVGAKELKLAQEAGKPYGIGGITLSDGEIKNHRELFAGAKFICLRDTDSLKALQASGFSGPPVTFGPDATFALDIKDDAAAEKLLKEHNLESGKFLCAILRLRWTPYWEIRPESRKPDPEKIKVNEQFAEVDHAKLREGITAWVRQTGMRVFIVPEMTYAVALQRPLLFDKLPDDVKPQVVMLDRYWYTAEANSVYARAAAILSSEQHSPIMAIANGTPAVLVRQPTDTRKGQMWHDVGLHDWIFEIDQTTGAQIAERVVQIGKDLPAARAYAAKARDTAQAAMKAMVSNVG
ncbi:MAG TPA: polysaccharide pyruvyl transferase family protein [Planctomycetota bacterium]|nr:polysaccharide pyruvyl transferase family protein [Planctomycetota bacterium]